MKTRDDVIETIQVLLADLESNPGGWENPTLERYLEAMGAWLDGFGKKYDQPPSWELIIQMLQAAKVYE